jgi:uncharacterized protein YjiS (DUF1127 family)
MTRHVMFPTRPLLLCATPRRALDDVRRLGEGWAAIGRTLTLWRRLARSRAELDLIPDHRLRDLPFDMATARHERAKPFWEE